MYPLPVSKVGKGTLLVDNPHSGLLRPDLDAFDVVGGLAESLELGVEGVSDLDGGLSMELGRERDLKENILHDVRSIGALELERLALEEDVVEAPGLGGQDRRHAGLSLFDQEGDVHGTSAGIASSPGFPGHGVGSVTIGAQRLAVSPRLGDGVNGLVTVETQEFGDNGGAGNLDEDDMIETNTVEGVEKSKASLDFVGLNHAREDVMYGELLTLTGEMIGDG